MTKKKSTPVTPTAPAPTEEEIAVQRARFEKLKQDPIFNQLVAIHKSRTDSDGALMDIVFALKLEIDELKEKING